MSDKSAGQWVGGIVGAVVGWFVGGPSGVYAGAMIGSGIGGYVDPPEGPKIQGPRLDDLTQQTSSYGMPLGRLYGDKCAVHGTVIWIKNNQLTEVVRKKKQGGKGGGGSATVTTYTYYATFAVALTEAGPAGIDKAWIANRLYGYTTSADVETILASLRLSFGFGGYGISTSFEHVRFYDGSDDQAVDPEMEADLGVGQTPAYRGTCYLVFYNLPLQEYGNSLLGAQVKVELVNDVSSSVVKIAEDTLQPDGMDDNALVGFLNHVPTTFVATVYFPRWTPSYSHGDYYIVDRHPSGGRSLLSASYLTGTIFQRGYSDVPLYFVGQLSKFWRSSAWGGGYNVDDSETPTGSTTGSWCYVGGTMYCHRDSTNKIARLKLVATQSESSVEVLSDSYPNLFAVAKIPGGNVLAVHGSGIAELDPTTLAEVSTHAFTWSIGATKSELRANVDSSGLIYVVVVGTDGFTHDIHVIDSVDFNQLGVYQTNLINLFVHTSLVFESMIGFYYIHLDLNSGEDWDFRMINLAGQSSDQQSLQSVVSQICTEVETINVTDIDVSGLAGNCSGYRVAGRKTARSILGPLQARYLFDIIPGGYKIKFLPRPQSSSQTIDADDMVLMDDAYFQLERGQEDQLPRQFSIGYIDETREYEENQQLSYERPGNGAVNIADVALPMVLDSDEAAQLSEILLDLRWLERDRFQLALPPSYRALEASDVITLTHDGLTYELRAEKVNLLPEGGIEIQGTRNSQSNYSSNAEGSSGITVEQTLSLRTAAQLLLLDIPLMRDVDDDPGFAVAVGSRDSDFPGAVLYKSSDGGQTWADMQAFADTCTFGYANTTLSADEGYVIDRSSELAVSLVCGELSSITESSMLSGQNYAAYGVDGRWEILQFTTATLQADGSYLVSGLLRGIKGTEWATGQHAVGDYFVWLDDADNAFIEQSLASISVDYLWLAATVGTDIDDAIEYTFGNDGVNLKPLSVVHPSASGGGGSDLLITFYPRTRLSSNWWGTGVEPADESTFVYSIDIVDTSASPEAVVRTLTLTDPSKNADGGITATYTAAQQVSDWGSPPPGSFTADIYQVSARVGRGYVKRVISS